MSKASSCAVLAIALTAFLISCSETVSPKAIAPELPELPELPKELMGITLAGDGTIGLADGPGDTAQFMFPGRVAVDSSGNVYVGDSSSNRIRKITSVGVVSTLAGTGGAGLVNGPGISAQFNYPVGVAVDSSGNVYVGDANNHSIRKITADGTVSTLAGTGTAGFADGPGSSAQFHHPNGVAVDLFGNVYVADEDNHRIRKITAYGMVSTLAGSGLQGLADGTGSSVRFSDPKGVAVDSRNGNVYVAGLSNHCIRKITADGTVSTLAGTSTAGFADGAGDTAQFNTPHGVAADSSGNVYVADYRNHRIRKITSEGEVSTLAGFGTSGFADGAPDMMQFNNPRGVAVDSSGNIYVADTNNQRIRKLEYIDIIVP